MGEMSVVSSGHTPAIVNVEQVWLSDSEPSFCLDHLECVKNCMKLT